MRSKWIAGKIGICAACAGAALLAACGGRAPDAHLAQSYELQPAEVPAVEEIGEQMRKEMEAMSAREPVPMPDAAEPAPEPPVLNTPAGLPDDPVLDPVSSG